MRGVSTSVECLLSVDPSHVEEREEEGRFNVGRVLVLNNPLIQTPAGEGGDSTCVERKFSIPALPCSS